MKELIEIQSKLNAPKGQYNSFGKYKYRSCEDILAAVKPLLKETNCTITMSDNVELIGTRFYVRATATLINSAGEKEVTTGFAREDETQKGKDGSQITGSASSYARKYALNGLFAIDDTRDTDSLNNTANPPQSSPTPNEQFSAYAKPAIEQAQTSEDLTRIYNDYPDLQKSSVFLSALTARRKALGIKKSNEK